MAHFIIYQKCPFNRQLSLAGYAQSSFPGELTHVFMSRGEIRFIIDRLDTVYNHEISC